MQAVNIANALAPQGTAASSGTDKAAAGGEGAFGSLLSQQLQQAFGHGASIPQGKALGVGDVSVLDGLKADAEASGEALGVLVSSLVAASDKGVEKGADADLLGQVSELVKDAKVSQKDLLMKQGSNVIEPEAGNSEDADSVPLETELIGAAILSVQQIGSKKSDVAETDGKKLPLDLPVDVDKKTDQGIDDATLAAMMGAQLALHAQQPVAERPKAADAGQFGMGERSPVALENATNKGVRTPEMPIQAEIPSGSKLAAESQSVEPQSLPQSFSSLMVERAGGNATNAATVPTLDVPPHVDSPHWGSAVGDKVVWMLGNQNQSAELRLNPPSLGPLEVRVSMNDGQATLSFVTPHAPVREAIEAATPRLREMLGDSGISLGGVSVNVGTFAQQQSASQEQAQNRSASQYWVAAANETESGSYAAPVVTSVRYLRDGGMVDLFA